MSKNMSKMRASDNRGFTLVELLVAMAIFVMFIGVVIGAYTGLIRAQRDANDYRIMYSEARNVFDSLVWEFRNGVVDYRYYHDNGGEGILTGKLDELVLVSKDAGKRTLIRREGDGVFVQHIPFDPEDLEFPVPPVIERLDPLNDPDKVRVSEFGMYVSPVFDPYDLDYTDYDFQQFHPKITVYAMFEREFANGRTYDMFLQTTVSSRIYNQVY